MDIRKEVRDILAVLINEANPSSHFKDRVFGRLTSTLYTRPVFNYQDIEREIKIIRNINFPENQSYAIFLKSFPITFVSKDPYTGKNSVGNEVWAVVRNNTITTIFFRNSSQREVPVKDVDNIINIKNLYNYYIKNKKEDSVFVDYFPEKTIFNQAINKRLKLDLPIVNINEKEWYIDEKNEKLIYSKNIKKEKKFAELSEYELEKVIDSVV